MAVAVDTEYKVKLFLGEIQRSLSIINIPPLIVFKCVEFAEKWEKEHFLKHRSNESDVDISTDVDNITIKMQISLAQ